MAECVHCGGVGMVLAENPDGVRVARQCICQNVMSHGYAMAHARIPARYEHCKLDSYDLDFPGAEESLGAALRVARRFVETYPVDTAGMGLLFTGAVGVGKTHLAVGVLQALIDERGAVGMFCDYRDLLKQIKNSYNPQVQTTELDILRPVFDAEVLVIDELGAQQQTDWVWDTVAHILNKRYNDKRTTIITSNYANLSSASGDMSEARRASREQTLGDRIGNRMHSRLSEMCVSVEMHGRDWRQSIKKARFG